VHLPADAGFSPNEKNENPFVSDAQGHFSFGPQSQRNWKREQRRELLYEGYGAGLYHAHDPAQLRRLRRDFLR